MDFLQDQLTSLLTNVSSASSSTTATSVLSTVHTLYVYASTYISALSPLLPTSVPTNSADLTALIVFALCLFTAYKVLDYVRRLIVFWVFLAIKLAAALAAVQVGFYVYTYGLEKTLHDVGWVWGVVEELFEGSTAAGKDGWNIATGAGGGQSKQYRQGQRKAPYNSGRRGGRWT